MHILLLLLACHSSSPREDDSAPSMGTPAYLDGVYACCGEGEGTGCCEGWDAGMCYEYGGIYGACIPDGEEIEGKVNCALCCNGEAAYEPMIETTESFDGYPEGCGPGDAPPSILVCVTCGDGVCGDGENRCVCPEDCE